MSTASALIIITGATKGRPVRLLLMVIMVLLLSMRDVRVVEAAELLLSFDNLYSDELTVRLDCKLQQQEALPIGSSASTPAPPPAAAADHHHDEYVAAPAPATTTTQPIHDHVFEFHDDESFGVTLQMEANATKPVAVPPLDYTCTANYTVAISALWSNEPVGTPRQVCNAQVNASAYLPLTEAPTLYVFCFMGVANYGPGCLFSYVNDFSGSSDTRADIRPDILFSCMDLYADNY